MTTSTMFYESIGEQIEKDIKTAIADTPAPTKGCSPSALKDQLVRSMLGSIQTSLESESFLDSYMTYLWMCDSAERGDLKEFQLARATHVGTLQPRPFVRINPLESAVEGGNPEIIRLLLDEPGMEWRDYYNPGNPGRKCLPIEKFAKVEKSNQYRVERYTCMSGEDYETPENVDRVRRCYLLLLIAETYEAPGVDPLDISVNIYNDVHPSPSQLAEEFFPPPPPKGVHYSEDPKHVALIKRYPDLMSRITWPKVRLLYLANRYSEESPLYLLPIEIIDMISDCVKFPWVRS